MRARRGLVGLMFALMFVVAVRAMGVRQDASVEPIAPGDAVGARVPFRITVVDSKTGRGVPMVELTTVNGIVSITDSAGVIAFDELGLMNEEVFLTVKSHGYTFPKDGFGFAGTRLRVTPGGSATLRIDRVNIAERLYRITGAGIYRDSVMLGDSVPIRMPLLNAQVLGQDSVQTALYRGEIYWFWGDTNRPAYPLGNFAMSGAVSELPADGGGSGLDPSVGVDLVYFVGSDGFSRPMCPIEGQPGPVWCDGLVTCADETGRERLLCRFARVKSLGEMYEQGIAQYNDEKEVFEPACRIPLDAPLSMRGQPVRVKEADGEYWYFAAPFPLIRCRADYRSLLDVTRYEAYTCLEPGARYDAEHPRLERDAAGGLVHGWKRDTAVIFQKEQNELVQKGSMKSEEALIRLRDVETDKPVLGHSGTVFWNAYRGRWVLIVQEAFGTSFCGEVWYAEAPALTGPWGPARKIITHDDYSFYNVAHHPFFDQAGGRLIYLEGTYTMAFSGAKVPTPRYDYNQIMYRLDLSDERLRCVQVGEQPSGTTQPATSQMAPVSKGYTIPIVDLADDTARQVVVDRELEQCLGHVSTVLLEDGRTMIAVYPKGHGRGAIVMKRSTDGGRTWSERLPVPETWATSLETPTIHRVVDPQGVKRLILFSGLYPVRMSGSEDDGLNWSPLTPVGDWGGIVTMGSVERLRDGRYVALFHDDGRFFRNDGRQTETMTLYQTFSKDGGLTCSAPEAIYARSEIHLCEPGFVRSPDGRQLAILLRENRRRRNSHVMFSNDEAKTWTPPRELPGALTGDRHTSKYAPDGRLFISFRDTTLESPTKGDWVGWVGTYDDIVAGREGQYRVRLMKNHQGADCAYPGVEILADGTFVTTTYGHWVEGEQPYIVSVRFKLSELDAKLPTGASETRAVRNPPGK